MKFVSPAPFSDASKLGWLLTLCGLVGCIFAFVLYFEAFPSASIDLKLTRQQIQEKAKRYAADQGFKMESAIIATKFESDTTAKTFLEYKLGLKRANEHMRTDVPTWYWSTRFFHSLDPDDLTVDLSPDGQLLALNQHLPNDLELQSTTHAAARQLALRYIKTRTGEDLSGERIISDSSTEHNKRTEHSFTWRESRTDLAGANIDTSVQVTGDRVTAFQRSLATPETWPAEYHKLRSYNQALYSVVRVIYYALYVIALIGFFWAVHAGLIRFRLAVILALIVGGAFAVEGLNQLSSSTFNYTRSVPFNDYVLKKILYAGWSGIIYGAITLALVGAGEAIYRLSYPKKAPLEAIFTREGLSRKHTVLGLVAGYLFCGVVLGWVVLYYMIGTKVGLYSPLENINDATLSAQAPVWSAMTIGIFASVHEELLYRVLCLSLVKRIVGNFHVANVVQAVAWACMHATYPQEPAYARSIELTVFGILSGLLLRRYGLLPCIVAHYVYDATLGVTPLFTSSSPLLKSEAALAVIPFAIVGALSYIMSRLNGAASARNDNPEHPYTNEAITTALEHPPLSEPVKSEPPPFVYRRLGWGARWALLFLLIGCSIAQFTCQIKLVGQSDKLRSTRDQAIVAARSYLERRGISTRGAIVCAALEYNLDHNTIRYILDNSDYEEAQRLATMPGHPIIWQVAFSMPGRRSEYVVELDSRAKPQAVEAHLPSESEGANLSRSEAQQLVENFVRREHPELVPYKVATVREDKMPGRTDYQFTLIVPSFKVGAADYMVKIGTMGDIVSGFVYWWDLPDKWSWHTEIDDKAGLVTDYSAALASLILLGAIGLWMIGVSRSRLISWSGAAVITLFVSIPWVVSLLNHLPQFFAKYEVDTPIDNYIISSIANDANSIASYYLLMFLLVAFAMGAVRQLAPAAAGNSKVSVRQFFKVSFRPEGVENVASRDLWIDAILCGYSFAAALCALHTLGATHEPNKYEFLAPMDLVCSSINDFSPYLHVLCKAFHWSILSAAALAIAAGINQKYARHWWVSPLFAALITALGFSKESSSPKVMAITFFVVTVAIYLLRAAIGKVVANNILTLLAFGFALTIIADLRVLIDHSMYCCHWDVTALVLTLLAPIIYTGILMIRSMPYAPVMPHMPIMPHTGDVDSMPINDDEKQDEVVAPPSESLPAQPQSDIFAVETTFGMPLENEEPDSIDDSGILNSEPETGGSDDVVEPEAPPLI